MEKQNDRRSFLLQALTGIGALATASPLAQAFAESCGLTPAQSKGPFYPEAVFSTETDLTRIPGHHGQAKGRVIVLEGIVQDDDCKPVEGVNVEIWQAAASGRYQHSQDNNRAELDPDFKYWAETFTDKNGKYSFRTIIPGAYPADVDWVRPPHIHFRINKLGFQELITQMYFAGQELNSKDAILQALPKAEQDALIVDFSRTVPGDQDSALHGNFSITIRRVARS